MQDKISNSPSAIALQPGSHLRRDSGSCDPRQELRTPTAPPSKGCAVAAAVHRTLSECLMDPEKCLESAAYKLQCMSSFCRIAMRSGSTNQAACFLNLRSWTPKNTKWYLEALSKQQVFIYRADSNELGDTFRLGKHIVVGRYTKITILANVAAKIGSPGRSEMQCSASWGRILTLWKAAKEGQISGNRAGLLPESWDAKPSVPSAIVLGQWLGKQSSWLWTCCCGADLLGKLLAESSSPGPFRHRWYLQPSECEVPTATSPLQYGEGVWEVWQSLSEVSKESPQTPYISSWWALSGAGRMVTKNLVELA